MEEVDCSTWPLLLNVHILMKESRAAELMQAFKRLCNSLNWRRFLGSRETTALTKNIIVVLFMTILKILMKISSLKFEGGWGVEKIAGFTHSLHSLHTFKHHVCCLIIWITSWYAFSVINAGFTQRSKEGPWEFSCQFGINMANGGISVVHIFNSAKESLGGCLPMYTHCARHHFWTSNMAAHTWELFCTCPCFCFAHVLFCKELFVP